MHEIKSYMYLKMLYFSNYIGFYRFLSLSSQKKKKFFFLLKIIRAHYRQLVILIFEIGIRNNILIIYYIYF